MAQGIYVGVSGKARHVNKIYVGVGGKARRIVKAYVGVGGKARLCFFSGVAWHSAVTLSVARNGTAAATVGNYALFAGGSLYDSTAYYATVNAYNASLTRSTPTALSVKRADMAATTVGNYALFGGGDAYTSSDADTPTRYATVNAYNTSLTRSTPTALSVKRSSLAATTVGNYALFGGGYTGDGSYYSSDTVDAYNTSLTRSTPTVLSTGREGLRATTVGNYALFGGGEHGVLTYSNVVDAYNTSLTRSTPTVLSTNKYRPSVTTIGNYALFAGGDNAFMDSTNVVNAYNTSLTRSIPTALSASTTSPGAAVNPYAIIPVFSTLVDTYNTSLTKNSFKNVGEGSPYSSATTISKYALFAGWSSNTSNKVDVFISG